MVPRIPALPALVFAALVLCLSLATPVRAADVAALNRALGLERLAVVLSAEGLKYGADLEAELFPGSGGLRWTALVARIHDPVRLIGIVSARMEEELDGRAEAVGAIRDFFEAEPGRRIIDLELAAREALLDKTVKDAAELAFEDMAARGEPRVEQLRRFVAANDLIDSNVAGALNSNLAFYRGMIEGGATDPGLSEQDMLSDLWSQEPQIRSDTETWLFPYLALAYEPLPDAELEAYIAFSETGPGKVLNAALLAAFDALFADLSHDLGYAAALFVQGEDI